MNNVSLSSVTAGSAIQSDSPSAIDQTSEVVWNSVQCNIVASEYQGITYYIFITFADDDKKYRSKVKLQIYKYYN